MLRISRSESQGAVLLVLEGKLLAPWVGELRAAIGHLDGKSPVILDVGGLSFADSVGARLLGTLQRNGVVLRAPSALIAALVAASGA